MPGLRTRSAGAKVTEEEYAQIEKLAEALDLNVSEWCREAMLRELRAGSASDPEMPQTVVGTVRQVQRAQDSMKFPAQ
jgi:hypothetical protein